MSPRMSSLPAPKAMMKLAKQNAPFERLVLTKEEALELFADNPFKVTLISEKACAADFWLTLRHL